MSELKGGNISGRWRLFANEHEGWTSYKVGISSKNKDGKWVNAYQPVRFKKGEEPKTHEPIDILIEKGFPTAAERTVDGQNRNYVLWQILEYSIISKEPEFVSEGFTALDSGDIPF